MPETPAFDFAAFLHQTVTAQAEAAAAIYHRAQWAKAAEQAAQADRAAPDAETEQ